MGKPQIAPWRSLLIALRIMSNPQLVQFGSKFVYIGEPSQSYAEEIDGVSSLLPLRCIRFTFLNAS